MADLPLHSVPDAAPQTGRGTRARLAQPFAYAWLCGMAVLLCSGCATTPYRFGRFHPQEPGGAARQEIVVEYGRPHKALDRLGWVVGLPRRILMFNAKTNNHHVSPETIEKLRVYLEENDITDVYVAVNDFDPKGQWRRLRENDRIAPVWKYSVGTLGWLVYTIFPYRVFGGDEYDPFTNSLNLTSDVPALALGEAAYAKDIHARELPGTYAAVNSLPLVSLWQQSIATNDVLGYARLQHDWEGEKQAYHMLYPHIGATTFGPAAHFVPVAGSFLSAGGAVVGHVTGRTTAALQEPQPIRSSQSGDTSAPPIAAAEQVPAKKSRSTAAASSLPENSSVRQADHQE